MKVYEGDIFIFIQSSYVNVHADAVKTLNTALKNCTLHPLFTVCVLKLILNQFLKPDSLLVLLTNNYVVFFLFTASAFLCFFVLYPTAFHQFSSVQSLSHV